MVVYIKYSLTGEEIEIDHSYLNGKEENIISLIIFNEDIKNKINIDKFINLEELTLENCNLTEFDTKTLVKLKKLTSLDLRDNMLTKFELNNNSILKDLNISSNYLTHFKMNKSLEYLNISYNNLKILDPCENELGEINANHNNFLSSKIIIKRRIYLLSKKGTRNGLEEFLPKGPVKDVCENKNDSEICYKCKKIVNKNKKINRRHLNIGQDLTQILRLENIITYESCC